MASPSRLTSRQKIIEAAEDIAIQRGLTEWTVEAVAARAGCAKGLVLYHFGSKETLLQELRTRVLNGRLERRIAALEPGGSEGLEQLWRSVVSDVSTGISSLWFALVAGGRARGWDEAWASVSRAAVAALELPPDADPGLEVLDTLNGFELALLLGRPADQVRNGYDRFWLRLLDTAL